MWSTKTYDKVVATAPIKSNFTTGHEITDDSPRLRRRRVRCRASMSATSGCSTRTASVVRRENFFWRYAPTEPSRLQETEERLRSSPAHLRAAHASCLSLRGSEVEVAVVMNEAELGVGGDGRLVDSRHLNVGVSRALPSRPVA